MLGQGCSMKAIRVRLAGKARRLGKTSATETVCMRQVERTTYCAQRCGIIRSSWGWHSPPVPIGFSGTFPNCQRWKHHPVHEGIDCHQDQDDKSSTFYWALVPSFTPYNSWREALCKYLQCSGEGYNLPLAMHLGIAELGFKSKHNVSKPSLWVTDLLRGPTWLFAHNQVHPTTGVLRILETCGWV